MSATIANTTGAALTIRQRLEQLFESCPGNNLEQKISSSKASDASKYHEIRQWCNKIIHDGPNIDLRRERPKVTEYQDFLKNKRRFCQK
ncbi:hypothetical protein RCL1_002916 [Eukaryota sp. TZLM3-RCL]